MDSREHKCKTCELWKADYGTWFFNGWSQDGSKGYCHLEPKHQLKSQDDFCWFHTKYQKELESEELARLRLWVNDLQSGMYVNCVYCGHRYGPKETTPTSMADALKAHIEQCPEHPMSKLRIILDARNAEIEKMKKENDKLEGLNIEYATKLASARNTCTEFKMLCDKLKLDLESANAEKLDYFKMAAELTEQLAAAREGLCESCKKNNTTCTSLFSERYKVDFHGDKTVVVTACTGYCGKIKEKE